ncbi:hypothetical protein BpHYR1_013927 [Brachionus plicatilis]|uniref:Uncharacterized protein n=1 Tax=Brachionus plicatilis TaxID=10195 RepID=A0A3M7R5A4_BRAPC|nr:hypothetical protein BpHYR1_013927 [Brachionus plicatilis]
MTRRLFGNNCAIRWFVSDNLGYATQIVENCRIGESVFWLKTGKVSIQNKEVLYYSTMNKARSRDNYEAYFRFFGNHMGSRIFFNIFCLRSLQATRLALISLLDAYYTRLPLDLIKASYFIAHFYFLFEPTRQKNSTQPNEESMLRANFFVRTVFNIKTNSTCSSLFFCLVIKINIKIRIIERERERERAKNIQRYPPRSKRRTFSIL